MKIQELFQPKIDSIIKLLEVDQSACLLSIPLNGKTHFTKILTKQLMQKHSVEAVEVCFAVSRADLEKVLAELQDYSKKEKEKYYLIHLAEDGIDGSWFIWALENLIAENLNTNLHIFLAASPGKIYRSLTSVSKVIFKNQFYLELMDRNQCLSRIKEDSISLGFNLDDYKSQVIYQETRGHGGMVKYIISRLAVDENFEPLPENLFVLPDIQMVLNKIVTDLPVAKWHQILEKQIISQEKVFYRNLGYIEEQGEIAIPLLKRYLEEQDPQSFILPAKKPIQLKLSYRETVLFDYLLKNKDAIVSRDDVSKILWGDNWLDKYSEWALSQVIRSIRKEINDKNLPYEIKTVKGQGFAVI